MLAVELKGIRKDDRASRAWVHTPSRERKLGEIQNSPPLSTSGVLEFEMHPAQQTPADMSETIWHDRDGLRAQNHSADCRVQFWMTQNPLTLSACTQVSGYHNKFHSKQ